MSRRSFLRTGRRDRFDTGARAVLLDAGHTLLDGDVRSVTAWRYASIPARRPNTVLAVSPCSARGSAPPPGRVCGRRVEHAAVRVGAQAAKGEVMSTPTSGQLPGY